MCWSFCHFLQQDFVLFFEEKCLKKIVLAKGKFYDVERDHKKGNRYQLDRHLMISEVVFHSPVFVCSNVLKKIVMKIFFLL